MADDPNDAAYLPGRGVLARVDVSHLTKTGDATTFEYTDRLGQEAEGFVMRWGDGFVAYENRCPHWSVPIGFDDTSFLDDSGADILCPMHGARFEADTGYCYLGPCEGDSLEKFEVELEGDVAVIRRIRKLTLSI